MQITIDDVVVEAVPADAVRSNEATRIHERTLAVGRHTARVELVLEGASLVAQDYVIQLEHDMIITARLLRACRDVVCDDGIACTTDVCEAGACVFTADDAVCGAATCDPGVVGADPSTGCVSSGVCASRGADFVCRAARGACDVEETCDGTSDTCPQDVLSPASEICRASAGDCDVEEACLGVSPDCPVDRVRDVGTVCRASAGVCDAIEVCDGEGAACPADAFVGASMTCRAATGACDQPETCTGSSASCPANTLRAAGTECRGALSACDEPEVCSGSSVSCPASEVGSLDSVALETSDEGRPVLGQITADTLMDVVAWGRDRVEVFVQAGGRLTRASAYTYPEVLRGVALADLDGDRVLDLVALLRGRLVVRRGNGDGRFSSTLEDALVSTGLEVGVVAMAGFSLDGRVPDSTIVLLNDRDVLTTRPTGTPMRLGLGPRYAVGPGDTALAIGDVDGDRFPDIVTSSTSGRNEFSVLFSRGDGSLSATGSPHRVTARVADLIVRPLHCSGEGDVVFMDPRGAVVVMKWDGSETFEEVARLEGPELAGIAASDLDGDGGLEIVALSPDRGLVYWPNRGELEWAAIESLDEARMRRWLFAYDGDGRGGDELLWGDGEQLHQSLR